MTLLSKLADRLILCPSRQHIDAGDKRREEIPTSFGSVEAWVASHQNDSDQTNDALTIVKFPGAAGRAERASVHPAEVWKFAATEIWTINPIGYGGSSGNAAIKSFPDTAESVYKFLSERYPNRPIVATGNSLGCISALYLSARFQLAGLLLRNPPPLRQMISTRPRYNWWNLGMARWVASEVPEELDAIQNARRSTCRCLFVQSEIDRVVPVKYQTQIIDAWAGEKRVFEIARANHADPVPENQTDDYLDAIRWLREALVRFS